MYKGFIIIIIEVLLAAIAYIDNKQLALIITLVIIPITALIPFLLSRRGVESQRAIKHRENTFNEINSKEFQEWELKTLKEIYKNTDMVDLYDQTYTAAMIEPAKRFSYPFDSLCTLEDTKIKRISPSKIQKKYLKFLGGTFRMNMTGFAMTKLDVNNDNKVEHVHAIASDYKSNLITAHILEWELYNLYKKEKDITDFSNIMDKLPLRKSYHGDKPPHQAIFDPSDNALPLISVQGLIIYKDTRSGGDDGWKIVVAQRSSNVTLRPNLWQFQPAGGFEVFGREGEENEILLKQGFDIRTALLREYAEELFRVDEFQHKSDSRDATSVLSEENVARLIGMIKKGTAHMEFIGTVVELAFLRHEMTFLIVIDDEEYCKHGFKGSDESKEIISMSPKDVRNYLSGGNLHSSSAGALQLAMKHPLLIERGITAELQEHEEKPAANVSK